jgi:methionyl-tRNA formyltransferase
MPSVLFFGSKPASAIALSELVRANWDVRKVIVSKKVHYDWYGKRTLESEAKKFDIEVTHQSEVMEEKNVDYVISYLYRHKVQKKILEKADIAAINFHAAPLPDYGGWGTYNRAILNDSTDFGCTCHYMNENFDDGDLVKVRRFPIDSSKMTAIELENRAQIEMLKLFLEILDMVKNNIALPKTKQDKTRNGYLTFEQMENLKIVSSEMSAAQIDKLARAFWFPPYQGAFFKLGENQVEVVPNVVKEKWILEESKNVIEKLEFELDNYKRINKLM